MISTQLLRIYPIVKKAMFSFLLMIISACSIASDLTELDSVTPEVLTEELLPELAGASFKEKEKLVALLESNGDILSGIILSSLLNGELYYKKADKEKLFNVSSQEDNKYRVIDVLDPSSITVLYRKEVKKQYKKVRSNNKLRKLIKLSLARITLVKGRGDEKIKALDGLLNSLDERIVALVASLYDREKSEDVKMKMKVLLSVHSLDSESGLDKKLESILFLKDRLEIPAKLALERLVVRLKDQKDPDSLKLRTSAESALKRIESKTKFYRFTEKLFFGLSLGSVLLLAAIGLAITFGVMGVINMAHGEMIMLGAYTTYVIQLLMPNLIDCSLFVAIPAAFMISGLVGVVIQRMIIRHLHGRPLETLLATFGISLILQQAVRSIFSPLNRQVSSPEWMSGALELNPLLSLNYNRLYILIFSLLVFMALVLIINKTSLGLHVRAVSQNRDMAKAMGVRTEWVDAMTFGLGSGVAGVAGVALSQLTNVGPNLGQAYIIDSFMVVVFGGVGNVLGTLVASFSLGIANKFMEPVTGAVLANILVLVFIILFIQKRPQGLFPQKGRAAE